MNTQELSEMKRRAANSRKREMRPCDWCGQPFMGLKFSRFCSNRCKQAAKNAKNRGTHRDCVSCGVVFMVTDGRHRKCEKCRSAEGSA